MIDINKIINRKIEKAYMRGWYEFAEEAIK